MNAPQTAVQRPRNAAKRQVDTSPGPWRRWRTQARSERCIRFVETFCRAPKGYGAGKPLRLAAFQKAWLREVLDGDVNSAAMLVPRGNGKSTLLAAVALWALFDDDRDGAPQIPIVAATLNQAKRSVYLQAVAMIDAEPELANRCLIFSGVGTERVQANGGELFPVAADPAGLQGLDPSLAVCDELGFIDVESWDSLLLAAGKRPRSLTIGIGTPGFDRENALWQLEQMVIEGRALPGFSFTAYRAEPGCAITDEAQWYRANPALGEGFMNIGALRTAAAMSAEAHFRIFRLGEWVDGVQSWLGDDARRLWTQLTDPWQPDPSAPMHVGVDIGLKRDSSAVVTCQVRPDGRRHVTARLWTPTATHRLDATDVMAHLRTLCATYPVEAISYDPRFFDVPAAMLLDEGLPLVEVPQSADRMTPIVGATHDEIRAGRLSHDGDPALTAHVLAAVARMNERGFTLSKGRSRDRIDAAVAMCLAVHSSLIADHRPTTARPVFWC